MMKTLINERRVVINISDDIRHGAVMKDLLEKAFKHFEVNSMVVVKLVGAIPEVSK